MDDFESRPPGSCRILLIAGNNPSSRLGFRLCESLVRHKGDTIFLVHFVKGSASAIEVEGAVSMLNTYTEIRVNHLLRRNVATMKGNLLESIEAEIGKLKPDLVVIGTEGQTPGMTSQGQTARPTNWTRGSHEMLGDNVAIALLKQAPLVPLLIVKPESVGPLGSELSLALKSRDEALGKARSGVRLMMEVGPTQLPMFNWISHRLTPTRDRFVFVRPHGRQPEGEEKRTSERLLNSFSLQAQLKGYEESDCLPVAQGRRDGLPHVVVQRKPDILMVHAPDLRSTPPEIIDMIKTCKTSSLIWRAADSSTKK
jgi:hypothetical protein